MKITIECLPHMTLPIYLLALVGENARGLHAHALDDRRKSRFIDECHQLGVDGTSEDAEAQLSADGVQTTWDMDFIPVSDLAVALADAGCKVTIEP